MVPLVHFVCLVYLVHFVQPNTRDRRRFEVRGFRIFELRPSAFTPYPLAPSSNSDNSSFIIPNSAYPLYPCIPISRYPVPLCPFIPLPLPLSLYPPAPRFTPNVSRLTRYPFISLPLVPLYPVTPLPRSPLPPLSLYPVTPAPCIPLPLAPNREARRL